MTMLAKQTCSMLEKTELRSGGHRVLFFHRYTRVVALGKLSTFSSLSHSVVGTYENIKCPLGTSF